MLKIVYLIIVALKLLKRLWAWFTCTHFYMIGVYAYLITRQNRTMDTAIWRMVLIFSGVFSVDWNLWSNVTSTILQSIFIFTALLGAIVSREKIKFEIKLAYNDIKILLTNNKKNDEV